MITDHVPGVVFLLTMRLSRREETWKTAEILIMRHQLAVLQRRQPRRPKLNWADRALLATLLSVIPTACRPRLQSLVTPDTIMRWHRDIVRRRQAARSMRGETSRPATRRNIRARILRLARETRRAVVQRRQKSRTLQYPQAAPSADPRLALHEGSRLR